MAANPNPEQPVVHDMVRPVVFVGLGSTGAKIVSRLKEFIGREQDPWTAAFCRYVWVTSEIRREAGVDPNLSQVMLARDGLTPRATVEAFSTNSSQAVTDTFNKWWPRDAAAATGSAAMTPPWIPSGNTVEVGAGGQRPLGRLLLHHKSLDTNLATTLQSIHTEIGRARSALPVEERGRVDAKAVDCYVFGLLAGGTCSGTLLDLAYVIKTGLPVQYLMGVFLLGDVCIEDDKQAEHQPFKTMMQLENTSHAIAELMLVQSPTGRRLVKDCWVRRIGATALADDLFDNSPYHRVTLVGRQNQAGDPLPRLENYIQFIVQYYGGLFSTGAHATQIGRHVDQQAQQSGFIESKHPARPTTFQRIGLLDLRVPKEKILALAANEMAKEIGTIHFNNADRARLVAALDQFQNRIGWAAFEKRFEPDLDQLADQKLEPLPDKPDEFQRLTEQRKKDIETHYGSWRNLAAPDPRTRLEGFDKAWREAVDEILRDTLGKTERGFHMGELQALLNDLSGSIGGKIEALNGELNKLDAETTGQNGLEQKVQSEIGTAKSSLPRGLVGRMVRMNWRGEDDVNEEMVRYRDALRKLAAKTLAKAALEQMRTEIESISVARKLVGHHAALMLFNELQRASDNAFAAESERSGIRQDVISTKESVQQCFVQPLLDDTTGNADHAPRRQVLAGQILSAWKSETGPGVFDSFKALVAIVRTNKDLRNPDQAMKSVEVKKIVQGLNGGLRRTFQETMDTIVGRAVDDLSVWEAIRAYVATVVPDGNPTKAQSVLTEMFREYVRCAQPFARLSPAALRDSFTPTREMFYLCDEPDAANCFAQLGIPLPDGFLSRLLNTVLGTIPTPMAGARAGRHELLLFLGVEGELPFYIQGFEGVGALLKNTSAAQPGELSMWSDARFPGWVETWRTQSVAPPLP